MVDLEEQQDELDAVFSMYGDTDCLTLYDKQSSNTPILVKKGSSKSGILCNPTGVFVICPEMDTSLVLDERHIDISFFPPFYFTFFLPPHYPSMDKLVFSLTSDWLSKQILQPIISQIEEIILEGIGSPILIRIFCYLQHDAIDDIFKKWFLLSKPTVSNPILDIKKIHQIDPLGMAPPANLLNLLISHNAERLLFRFDQEYHECIVCSSMNRGENCIRFEKCEHICCSVCVQMAYSIKVKEGNILEFTCLACDTHATPAQLSRLLSPEQLERIEKLSISRALDTMEDVIQCPRCDFPVIVEVESKLGHCEKCSMAFCIFCKKSYHAKNPCSFDMKKDELLAYKDSDGQTRKRLEDKYGRERLQNALNEQLSLDFLKENNVSCPCCRSSIEKSGGCNKMACLKCGTYFCWICRMTLTKDNPYKHFSNMLSPCYNRLFEGLVHDNEFEESDEDENFQFR